MFLQEEKKTRRNSFSDRSMRILYKQLPPRRAKGVFLPRVSDQGWPCGQFGFGFLASRIPLWVTLLEKFSETNTEGYFLSLIVEIYKNPTADTIFHGEVLSPQAGNKAKDICSHHCSSDRVQETIAKNRQANEIKRIWIRTGEISVPIHKKHDCLRRKMRRFYKNS